MHLAKQRGWTTSYRQPAICPALQCPAPLARIQRRTCAAFRQPIMRMVPRLCLGSFLVQENRREFPNTKNQANEFLEPPAKPID
jgi:hypothetical protein